MGQSEGGEDSTFYEARKRFKDVKGRLERGTVGGGAVEADSPIILTPIKCIQKVEIEEPPIQSISGDPLEVVELLFGSICEALSFLAPSGSFYAPPSPPVNALLCESKKISINKMESVKLKMEGLLEAINRTTVELRETNNLIYGVFKRMDSACKEIVLNNADLLEIIQKILLKFCEAGDLLDFDQSETTINVLFEMSKMVFIYKSKINELLEGEYEIHEDYKRERFPFYYLEEEESLDSFYEPLEIKNKDDLPYTEWTTWIETFKGGKEVVPPIALTIPEMAAQLCLRTLTFDEVPKKAIKIGEATFSEVFKSKHSVYKIIPLGEGETLTPFDVFVGEAYVHKTLSNEKGVCPLQDVFLIKGAYSQRLLRAWDAYGEEVNERPSKFTKDQLYGVIVMEYGGVPLEKASFARSFNLVHFLKSLVRTLSYLERKYEFEHRDLHWGNVLVSKNSFRLIDFTLSRIVKDNKIVYNDLNRYNWLFEGDSTVDQQFEIYRTMRGLCKGDWKEFNSTSNYLWLVYLIEKCYNKMSLIRPLSNKEKSLKEIVKKCKDIKELDDYFKAYTI